MRAKFHTSEREVRLGDILKRSSTWMENNCKGVEPKLYHQWVKLRWEVVGISYSELKIRTPEGNTATWFAEDLDPWFALDRRVVKYDRFEDLDFS
jgi:hypothetical protein